MHPLRYPEINYFFIPEIQIWTLFGYIISSSFNFIELLEVILINRVATLMRSAKWASLFFLKK